jgi:TRAP-type C4-dicarboxylate transport system substrate-binding protein
LKGYDDFVVIGAFATEPESIHTRAPVASLDDLKGKKIRVHSAVHAPVLQKLGMVPVFMQVNGISRAISNGTIHGAAVPPTILVEYGVGRILGNHYMLHTSAAAVTVLMNRRKFEALPEKARDIIRKYSGEWYAARFIETITAYNAEIVKQLESDPKRKVVFPSAADRERAKAAFAAVIADWIQENPRNGALLRAARAELARIRGDE